MKTEKDEDNLELKFSSPNRVMFRAERFFKEIIACYVKEKHVLGYLIVSISFRTT
jgi:hypothetical protein